ncbi:MAG: 30S ribosomal protein S20 [Candidatus Glassbacteria bacterium RBG_16_58_8]|uniref:Small ribosomal subunit protein bS20 n=1 Tax=Candidatus Glassbacteria bacterium RBG_16_58_8 TaxID=1817866 RepID=A0A1F5YD38_9BACT|nr:MAG: 30S ribosomal protein S20 [Candidatus Glassbacteria bacterium RBG_16_58_8]
MPNVKSAKKRVKTSSARRIRNRAFQSTLKTFVKKAFSSKNPEEAGALLGQALSIIDKSTGKGVIHKNTAARLKARLAARVNRLST